MASRHHPRLRHQQHEGIDRQQNPVCGVSAMAGLCYAHGTRVLTGLSEAGSTPRDRGPLVGDVQCSMADDTVEPSAHERDSCGTRYAKRNQTQQAEKNQKLRIPLSYIPLSHTTAKINQKVVYTTFFW